MLYYNAEPQSVLVSQKNTFPTLVWECVNSWALSLPDLSAFGHMLDQLERKTAEMKAFYFRVRWKRSCSTVTNGFILVRTQTNCDQINQSAKTTSPIKHRWLSSFTVSDCFRCNFQSRFRGANQENMYSKDRLICHCLREPFQAWGIILLPDLELMIAKATKTQEKSTNKILGHCETQP